MKNKWLALTAGALVLMSATVAQAALIEGSIGLTGLYTVDDNDLTAATLITFGETVAIGGAGDFSTIANFTSVTMATSLTFEPLFTVTSNPLWEVDGFAFELTSLAITNEQTDSLSLSGAGTVSKAGFEDSLGTWVATFNNSGSSFTWSSSSSVPDGGATLSMFGLSLLGLRLARKKLMANS